MDVEKPGGDRAPWPAFPEEAERCLTFLREFEEDGSRAPARGRGRRRRVAHHKYLEQLQEIANRKRQELVISLDDVKKHFGDDIFVSNIQRNTPRYLTLFADAADSVMPEPNPDELEEATDVMDIFNEQRIRNIVRATQVTHDQARASLPKELMRRYNVRIHPLTEDNVKPQTLRSIGAHSVGGLVTVKGIVTKVTDVKPLMRVVTYVCDVCGWENYQTVATRTFMPLQECQSEACTSNQTKGRLHMQTRGSKFEQFQTYRLQEIPSEVPVGHIPRSINVHVSGELTRQCVPGDIVTLTGIYMVTPYSGYRAIRAGLTADTHVEGQRIQVQKKSYKDFVLTETMQRRVEQVSEDGQLYDKLAMSIAPEIFGHEDIKKALLLLLVSGVTRIMGDGMRIRGDINVLLLGDPGVAKSQLLKHVASLSPRGVYTTGKGSSGVGLTAAVLRDDRTGEMTLEGGALVLADMGVCCIDEFDKMEEGDQTAIHEVMEQQTVSIAKAGIATTLNARSAVLAAANPVWGRYNVKRSPEENIGLPAALLSRFDLTFIILDTPDEANDLNLARHVAYVHREQKAPPLSFEPFDAAFMRAFIARARTYEPWVPKELRDFIVGHYVQMRQEPSKRGEKGRRFCTARSLLSLLRLAQALARIRFANVPIAWVSCCLSEEQVVEESDVLEAIRLLYMAKASLINDGQELRTPEDKLTRIFELMKLERQSQRRSTIGYRRLRDRVVATGYTEEDLQDCLQKYEAIDIIQLSRDRHHITFID